MPEGAFFHQREEHGYENQNVDRRGNHSTHNRRRDRFHDVRADAAFPQNRNQARQHDAHRHEFRPQAGAVVTHRLRLITAGEKMKRGGNRHGSHSR